MSINRYNPLLVLIIAALVVLLAVLIGGRLLNRDDSLLRNVVVRDRVLTPNAAVDTSATAISHEP